MTKSRIAKMFFPVLTMVLIAACTNTRQDISAYTVTRSLIEAVRNQGNVPTPPDPGLVDRTVKDALAATDGPLALISFEKNKSVALLRQIETNGPYRTWASYASSERRSITTRSGVVTSTRGLGFDLMSSSASDFLKVVQSQGNGIERQVLRHLDGENIIVETEAYCAFNPGEAEVYTMGELRQSATRIDVFCKTDEGSFQNHYLVNNSGRILEARQWLGPDLGLGTLQMLR